VMNTARMCFQGTIDFLICTELSYSGIFNKSNFDAWMFNETIT
jgi:hypothetical protein